MANFLLSYPIFTDIILPFLLIFVLIFAILQKSKLLGEGKMQIDAIISFVIASIFVTFTNAVNIVTQMTIFLTIALVLLFVFMLIYGFAYGDTKGNPLEGQKWVKPTIGILAFIAVVVGFVVASGWWDSVWNFFSGTDMGANVLFIVVIVAAIIAVIVGSGKGEKKD